MTTIDANLDAALNAALGINPGRHATTNQDLYFLQVFIDNGGQARPAALAAGFSESTASTLAYNWIRSAREDSLKPDLWDMWIEHRNKLLTHLDVTEDRILTEYARLAFFDPIKLLNEDGTIRRLQDMDIDTRRAINSVEIGTTAQLQTIMRTKFADKKGCLDSLAKIMGMVTEKVEHSHSFKDLLAEIEDETGSESLVKTIDITPEATT